MKPLLEIENLTKTYDGKNVIENFTLEVKKGERLAVIGPNGSGKTTLIKIINLLETPTSGKVYFGGANLQNTSEKWAFRRKMALVFQKPAVFNTTVSGNISIGLKIRGKRGKLDYDKVKETMDTFNLTRLEGKNALKLSGGEKQLLSIARAIVVDPELLLLDEPFSNLDEENISIVEGVIEEINSTIIMTSPNAYNAKQANRTVKMIRPRRY